MANAFLANLGNLFLNFVWEYIFSDGAPWASAFTLGQDSVGTELFFVEYSMPSSLTNF